MRKGTRNFLILIVIMLVGAIAILSLNPLRGSEEGLREDILGIVPIGTSIEDVIDVIESDNTWRLLWIDEDRGFFAQWPTQEEGERVVGEQSMRVFLGEYFSFRTIRQTFETPFQDLQEDTWFSIPQEVFPAKLEALAVPDDKLLFAQ